MANAGEEVSDEDEAEWYLRRMDAGLSSLQNADYVLAWVCMEDDGVSRVQCSPIQPILLSVWRLRWSRVGVRD